MNQEDHDILIGVATNVKDIKEDIGHLRRSDAKQWEKIDTVAQKVEGHDKTLIFLTRGFWWMLGTSGFVGMVVWFVKNSN